MFNSCLLLHSQQLRSNIVQCRAAEANFAGAPNSAKTIAKQFGPDRNARVPWLSLAVKDARLLHVPLSSHCVALASDQSMDKVGVKHR